MAQSNNYSWGNRGQSNGLSCQNACIFRVPQPIRNLKNKEAYDPSIVSLGPYHKDCTMDEHKHEAVERMASRIQKTKEFLVAKVQEIEKEIREHYEEAIKTDVDGESFSLTMTKDACFILEFFKCAAKKRCRNDQICFSRIFQNKGCKNSMHSAILTDIMKLENQVPLCILITLLKQECNNSSDNAITKLAAMLSNSNLFRKGFPFDGDEDNSIKQNDNSINPNLEEHIKKGARHLLDLYRMVIKDHLMLSKSESHSDFRASHGKSLITPSAKNFENAGIEFKPGEIRIEKNRFRNSKLFLPQIKVKYRTEVLLRNLMAYEECQRCSFNPDQETVISDYVCLLDRLIDTEKDVAVLRDSEIIRSFVGSDKVVVDMFNNLAIGITIEPPDDDTVIITIEPPGDDTVIGSINDTASGSTQKLEEVMREAIEHYNSQWKVLLSEFQQAHFSKPWYTVSLVAATALLVMTVIQTVYTVR